MAFANAEGGSVYVGVDDNGVAISSFKIGKESVQQWTNEIKNKTIPSIIPDVAVEEMDGLSVLVFSIQEFPIKPVAFKGRYYKRVKNANYQMNLQEISDLHLKTFNSSWDYYPSPHYDLGSIDLDKVNRFIESSNGIRETQIQDDPLTVLRKFEMLKENGQIANACHLLFSKNEVFDATISIGRFSTETSIKDSIVLRSDLFTEVEATLAFVRKHMNKNYIITGDPKREERWEYPLDALREIVVNMIVHRDYQNTGDSIIKIFDHKIEFYNPGGLGNGMTFDELCAGTYTSYARNRKIADLFREAGIIEKYGSGIKRITNAFVHYGLTAPTFEAFQNGFRVTVYANGTETNDGGVNGGVRGGVNGGVNLEKVDAAILDSNSNSIFSFIAKNPGVNILSLINHFSVPKRTVERWVKQLKDDRKIEFRGAPKTGGYWVIGS
ncbi:ATP-binding protein [Flavobacterium sp. IMCC34518]|uniref:ATP-binding protein n=1 Tax=Flavobacterium sp. IMCC34518 TaxID=3003623 RepID=UPI0024825E25|nr:ATP-binding protein [Flavobacterium sp. IMCC34518]